MGRRLPGFTRKVIYCAHPIAARFSLPFELPGYKHISLPITVLHLCTAAYAPASIWEPLWWEPLMGAGSARLCTIWRILTHCAQRCTLRTGEYSHGDRMEALPVPVVLRLNRGGRKSRRAICNCSRCAAAPFVVPSKSFDNMSCCWSIASCTKR